MYEGQRLLAVIPARGGSKGLPGKNTKEIAGKPLIAWSIEAARQSRYIDELIVSTDCQETARIATLWGANVPFMRPAKLATDEAKSIDVIYHALEWYKESIPPFTLVMFLQPTSPLRIFQDIDGAVELLFVKRAKAIVSVCPVDHHPWWTNTLPENGSMRDFLRPEIRTTNRQALPQYYRLNGAIYIAYTSFLAEIGSFIGVGTFAYLMPTERSIDIDTLLDFKIAELLLADRNKTTLYKKRQ